MNSRTLLFGIVLTGILFYLTWVYFRKCPVVITEEYTETTEPVAPQKQPKSLETITKDLFEINEMEYQKSDLETFERLVREWDRSILTGTSTDAEQLYNTVNALDVDSDLFEHVVRERCTSSQEQDSASVDLLKRIVKQLPHEAVQGELYNVLFKQE